jgi:hypothetical protein
MIVSHAMDRCPQCDIALVGGSVKRTREVIELAPSPVQISQHQYLERRGPLCGKRWVPQPELADQVLGQGRFGIELISLIATLREEGRLPVRMVQWYLQAVHQLPVSVGAIVAACHTVARLGREPVEEIRAQVQASPVLHDDETGWRENGHNAYVWAWSTETERLFTHGSRAKTMVDEVLGEEFRGVLVSDFYSAYHHGRRLSTSPSSPWNCWGRCGWGWRRGRFCRGHQPTNRSWKSGPASVISSTSIIVARSWRSRRGCSPRGRGQGPTTLLQVAEPWEARVTREGNAR